MGTQKSIVIMNLNVSDAIINHAFMDEFHECGGYLLGSMIEKDGLKYFYVTQMYYEKDLVGSENEFMFPLFYESRALNFAKSKNLEVIGCYHSHGQYTSAFSETDRNVLEKHWASNKICMIFSPKYFTLNCETVFKDYQTQKPQVLIKDGAKYLTFDRFYSQNEQLEKYL